MRKEYFIEYNCKFIESRVTLKGALEYIKKRGFKNGFGNCLAIVDREGNQYNPVTGEPQEIE